MATKTIYNCDRCNKEFSDRKDLMSVSAGVGNYYGSDSWERRWSQDWCFDCLDAFKIRPEERTPRGTIAPIPPTLEDVIREIVRQENGNG